MRTLKLLIGLFTIALLTTQCTPSNNDGQISVIEYNDTIVSTHKNVVQSIADFDIAIYTEPLDMLQVRYIEVGDVIKDAKMTIDTLGAFEEDKSFAEALNQTLDYYDGARTVELSAILRHFETKADDDLMDFDYIDSLTNDIVLGEELHFNQFQKTQREFAEKHQFELN